MRHVYSPGGVLFQLAGSPDMVLEIVSTSSTAKDRQTLLDLYWRAGISEYWLIDLLGDSLRFDLHKRAAKGYVTTRRLAGGWLKSGVFERSFRLTAGTDPLGKPRYRLEARE